MQIRVFPLGPLDTNCILVHTEKEAVAVDPGGSPAPVLAYLKENALSLSHVLLTHLHFDHTYGVAELARACGAKVLGSEEDRWMLETELGRGGVWGLPPVPDYEYTGLEAGDLPLLGVACRVLATPGHTPGGLSFYFENLQSVIAGDCLFYRSVGRTDFPRGNREVLLRSIRERLFSLPEATTVYAGHGPSTSIGDEKRNNPHASDFSLI